MWRDLRHAWRSWRRHPGVMTLAIANLAIGVGLSTAIFSVVESVLVRPLSFGHADRLVTLVQTPGGRIEGGVGAWTAQRLRRRGVTLESVASYDDAQATLVEDGRAEILRGMRVSPEFFDTLGVSMDIGRGFANDEDRPGRANVVVLTHQLWTNRFGADVSVVGRLLDLNGEPHRVVGILPDSFRPLRMTNPAESPTYYMPLVGADVEPACRSCAGTRAVATMRRSATLGAARAEVTGLMRALVQEYPADYRSDTSISIVPLRTAVVGRSETALWAALGAVLLVLLIGCANVACVQFARAMERRRELAVRAALGASRRQIVVALLIDGASLGVVGSALGVMLAWVATMRIESFAPPELARFDEVSIDARVLAFAAAATLLTTLSIGLAPAWWSGRMSVHDALKQGADRVRGTNWRLRSAIIAGEIAIAFALAVATGLLVRTVVGLERLEAGFDASHVLTLTPVASGYNSRSERLNYFQRLMATVAAVPGVQHVGMTSNVPLSHTEPVRFRLDEGGSVRDADLPTADMFVVAGDYFGALRIPLKRGRLLSPRDGMTDPPAALVSESFARRFSSSVDPVGRRVRLGTSGDQGPWLTIVGIVGDVHSAGLDREPDVAIYQSQASYTFHYTRLVARVAGDPMQFEGAVRAAIRSLDPMQPVFHVQPMDDYVSASMAERRFALTQIGALGSVALLLAALGVYGVMSYSVAQRSAEFGIRAALGASRSDLLGMIVRQCLAILGVGLVAGVFVASVAARSIAALLFGVRGSDPATLAGAAAVLLVAALAGCYAPARKAADADPLTALTSDF